VVRDQPWQKVYETPISTNKKLGIVACAGHPSYVGDVNRRMGVQASLCINMRPYLKNNQSRKSWKHGLSGKVLA
jgi:hypothetical protein